MGNIVSDRSQSGSIAFHLALLGDPEFIAGKLDTGFIPRFLARNAMTPPKPHEKYAIAAALVDLIEGEKPSRPGLAPVSAWKLTARRQGLRGSRS